MDLPGAGRAGHHHQSPVQHGKLLQHGRQRSIELFEIFKRQHLGGNLAEHSGDAVFLIEEICAEAGDVGDFIAEIDIAGFFEDFDLVLGRDFVQHAP